MGSDIVSGHRCQLKAAGGTYDTKLKNVFRLVELTSTSDWYVSAALYFAPMRCIYRRAMYVPQVCWSAFLSEEPGAAQYVILTFRLRSGTIVGRTRGAMGIVRWVALHEAQGTGEARSWGGMRVGVSAIDFRCARCGRQRKGTVRKNNCVVSELLSSCRRTDGQTRFQFPL